MAVMTDKMTLDQLRRRLRTVHARLGMEGRLALTLDQDVGDRCYVTHWVRPDGSAFEDCRAVGQGTVVECLAALERYAAAYRPQLTAEDVGRTLGLLPPRPTVGLKVAAE